ncbi:MAG: hypothetical protein SVT56_09030 [Chloroflexota bacterium]|jgi:hypothetical protein|nr:hypothetical protein [Chloroflexota bacterium]
MMHGPGIGEILLISGAVILPCLGILVFGGIIAVIILLVRKK